MTTMLGSAVISTRASVEAIGITRPASVPIFYRVSASRFTHAGIIEVESSLGVGSVFRVRLPLANGEGLSKKIAPVTATANPVI